MKPDNVQRDGEKPRLSREQRKLIKDAVGTKTPADCGIQTAVWSRAAIGELIAKEFGGRAPSLGTISRYKAELDLQKHPGRPLKGGRPRRVVGSTYTGIIRELLCLTGLSASSLFSYLSTDSYFSEVMGKKATFHNRLDEAGIEAQIRRKARGVDLVNRCCLRLRLLVFRISKGKGGFIAVLCGYEVETGFVNCRIYNVRVACETPIANAANPDEVPLVAKTDEGDVTEYIRFKLPEKEVASFVEESRRRLSLPLTRLEITQRLEPGLTGYATLDRTLRSPWIISKNSGKNRRDTDPGIDSECQGDLQVNIDVGTDQVAVLPHLPMSASKLGDVLSERIDTHNIEVAVPAIAAFKQETRAKLAKEKVNKYRPNHKTAELRLLLKFSKGWPADVEPPHQVHRIRVERWIDGGVDMLNGTPDVGACSCDEPQFLPQWQKA